MAQGIVESSNQESEEKQQAQQGGIQRAPLVQRLLDAPSLPAFIQDLIMTQATTVAGTEAVGFLIERGEQGPNLRLLSHLRPDNSPQEVREAAVRAFMEFIKPCIKQGTDGAIEINVGEGFPQSEIQYCLVTLLRADGEAVAASAVITRCINLDRAKQRLNSMQLVAGYFELFTLRHKIEQTGLIAQSHQHVLQLATSVATAEGFDAAAMNLCNELANRFRASRVSLGWLKGRSIKVRALSHTEEFDKKQELIVQLQRAMEECADQEEIVQYHPAGKGSENVTREAQALSRSQGGNIILSLPLRHRAEVTGVVTLEFLPNTVLTPQVAHDLAVAVELLAPQLYDRHLNDRWLITKAGLSLRTQVEHVTGPRYMMAKVITVLAIAGILFVALYRPMYHVSAPFSFAAPNKTTVVAPFEGYIEKIGHRPDGEPLRPGDTVKAGEVLAVLDTYELRDRQKDAIKKMGKAQADEDRFRAAGKIAEANAARLEKEAAQAEADLYEDQIRHATITAPVAGVILKGDLSARIGQKAQVGDSFFEIAPDDALRIELSVAERDIQDVKVGATGKIATDAIPMDRYGFHVTRIIPEGEAKEGSNTFTVYGIPDQTGVNHPDWRPGAAGEARVDVERRSLAWIWTHRLIDFLRLKLWM